MEQAHLNLFYYVFNKLSDNYKLADIIRLLNLLVDDQSIYLLYLPW